MERAAETAGVRLINIRTDSMGEVVYFKNSIVHRREPNGPGQGLEVTAYTQGIRRRRYIDILGGRLSIPFFTTTELIDRF